MNIELRFISGEFAEIKMINDSTILVEDLTSQSERSDVLRELLDAAYALSNPRTPLSNLLAVSLEVAGTLETEAAR